MGDDLTEQERFELAGALCADIFTFFYGRDKSSFAVANRRAAHKTAQVVGRVAAAVLHDGAVGTDYLMLARRFEVLFSKMTIETAEGVAKSLIKTADVEATDGAV